MKRMLAILIVFMMSLAGCGGGGGGDTQTNTVSVVAAAVAPLAGQVSLKDSLGNPSPALTTLLASDGSFTFDVTGLTPPFFLKASGVAGNTGYELHSVVARTGRANINPLTEAQVKAATRKDPAALYEDPSTVGMDSDQIEASLEQAAADLMTMLKPLLDAWEAPTNMNPITDVYIADGTGLDKLFDVAKVDVENDTITVTDRSSDTPIGTAIVNGETGFQTMDEIDTEEAGTTGNAASDLDQIKLFLAEWLTEIKKVSAAFANDEYIDQNAAIADMAIYYEDAESFGINNGKTLAQEIVDNLEDYDFLSAIKSISNISISEKGSSPDVYMVNFLLNLQLGNGSPAIYPVSSVAVSKSSGEWKITGNGYYADASDMDLVHFMTGRFVYPEQTTDFVALEFELDDNQNVFSSATVTGPGLPSAGITFSPNPNDSEMQMPSAQMVCTRVDNGVCIERDWNTYNLTDSTIEAMPQICTYEITFTFAEGGTETHHVQKSKPLKSSQLTENHFPRIHNLLDLDLAWAEMNLLGDTINLSYTTPSAFLPVHADLDYTFHYSTSTDWNDFHGWVNAPLGSNKIKSITIPELPDGATLERGDIDIFVEDSLWRAYETRYNFR